MIIRQIPLSCSVLIFQKMSLHFYTFFFYKVEKFMRKHKTFVKVKHIGTMLKTNKKQKLPKLQLLLNFQFWLSHFFGVKIVYLKNIWDWQTQTITAPFSLSVGSGLWLFCLLTFIDMDRRQVEHKTAIKLKDKEHNIFLNLNYFVFVV